MCWGGSCETCLDAEVVKRINYIWKYVGEKVWIMWAFPSVIVEKRKWFCLLCSACTDNLIYTTCLSILVSPRANTVCSVLLCSVNLCNVMFYVMFYVILIDVIVC